MKVRRFQTPWRPSAGRPRRAGHHRDTAHTCAHLRTAAHTCAPVHSFTGGPRDGAVPGRDPASSSSLASRNDRCMVGFSLFEPLIRGYGGIASRRELLADGESFGYTETDFRFAQHYGRLDRIRPGWYASSDLPADSRAAWRAGGPLACVSALLHHGILDPRELPPDTALHVCVPRDGHLPKDSPDGVVVHWSSSDHASGSRRSVTPLVALRHARQCAPALVTPEVQRRASARSRASAARAAEVSRSRIQSGTARAAKPSDSRASTVAASSSPTSQPSSRPPSRRRP